VAEDAPHGDEEDRQAPTRRFERVPVSVPVVGWASQFMGTPLRGTVLYVSTGGLMVEFPVQVVRDSVLRLVFQTRQGPLEVDGRVVWTSVERGGIRHGLAFPEPQGAEFVDRVVGENR